MMLGNWKLSIALSFATLLLVAPVALSAAEAKPLFGSSSRYYANEFGKTLPPIGFVKFCSANSQDCKTRGDENAMVDMTPEHWDMLTQINDTVNQQVAPVSDRDLYGQDELWAFPTDAGDCEDYVLLKKRNLQEAGVNPASLLITVVLDEKGEGHAVLTVVTDKGDYILDNRRDEIMRWDATNYKFLKRQSKANPLQWTSLIKQDTQTSGYVASGNKKD